MALDHLLPNPSTAQTHAGPQLPDLIPIPSQPENDLKDGSIVDQALVKLLGREGLIRLKAMEELQKFLKGRTITSTEKIEQLYDIFYNKIKNGTKKQGLREQRIRQSGVALGR